MRTLLQIAVLTALSTQAHADIKLPRLISDGMVLQREVENEIWGWAEPAEVIHLHFGDTELDTEAGEDGMWSIVLPAQRAGGPYSIELKGHNAIQLRDVYFGDVWVCSGQSNMEISIERIKEAYPGLIERADNPEIRHFAVATSYNFKEPQTDLASGAWQGTTPEAVPGFSAVAYFFAQELHREYGVPIGLIRSAVGGSPVEAWMSDEALAPYPESLAEAQRHRDDALLKEIEETNQRINSEWYGTLKRQDKGLNASPEWFHPQADASDWRTIDLPAYWDAHGIGPMHGAVWFRKEIELPEAVAGKAARMHLGTIVDADTTYVNGVKVGETTYQYPPRRYTIPEGVLKAGKNVIVIRAISNASRGEFTPDKPFTLYLPSGQHIDLRGTWHYKIGAEMPAIEPSVFTQWKPMGLYNAMIAPLHRKSVKGVIWYQGESNVDSAREYSERFATMVRDWRSKWEHPALPFILAQLPLFGTPRTVPAESNWAVLQNEQLKAVKALPHTGLAVLRDLGEWNDIHPLNKQDVGKRFAHEARRIVYQDNGALQHPIPQEAVAEGAAVRISFAGAAEGFTSMDGKTAGAFTLAGVEGQFHKAEAILDGAGILVRADAVPEPATVRYAWAENPIGANVFDKEGLPLPTFELAVEAPAKEE